jgi:hypothetical protein
MDLFAFVLSRYAASDRYVDGGKPLSEFHDDRRHNTVKQVIRIYL